MFGESRGREGGVEAKCEDLCPSKEVKLRTRERLLHRLERGHQLLQPVKEYSRPSAGQKLPGPHDIRTPRALARTVSHLLSTVINTAISDQPNVVYDFVFDRLRAVRQDIIFQGLEDRRAVNILSAIVRFHVVSGASLAGFPVEKFDPHINSSHLLDCCKTVLILQERNSICEEDRAEMIAIYVLSNLASSESLNWTVSRSEEIRRHPLVAAAVSLALAFRANNYVRYFRLLASLPTLLQLAALSSSCHLLTTTLRVMTAAYSAPNCRFPVGKLATILRPVDDRSSEPAADVGGKRRKCAKLVQLCTATGLKMTEDQEFVVFNKKDITNFSLDEENIRTAATELLPGKGIKLNEKEVTEFLLAGIDCH